MKCKLIKNNNWKDVPLNSETKNIPINWGKKCFSQLFEITSSRRVHADKYVPKGIPFFRGTEITNFKKGIETFDTFISTEFFEELKSKYEIPKKDDILITAVGTVGSVLLIENNFDFYFKDGNIIWLKNQNNENKKYIEFFLNSKYTREKIFGLGDGSAYNALTIKNFSSSECLLPPINQQNLIAQILSKQNNLISNIESLIEKNNIVYRHLHNESLSGNLRIKENNKQLIIYKNKNWKNIEINGELKKVPTDWDVKKINDTINFNMGGTPKKEADNYAGDLPWITISNLTNKYISDYTAKITRNKNTRVFPKGTLIGSFKMTVGKFGFLTEESSTNEAIIGIKEDGTTNNLNYLYYCLPEVFINNAEKNGQGLLLLNQEKIKNLEYLIPPINEQILIANFLEGKEKAILKQKELLAKERKKFDWLLDNLLTGKYLVEEI